MLALNSPSSSLSLLSAGFLVCTTMPGTETVEFAVCCVHPSGAGFVGLWLRTTVCDERHSQGCSHWCQCQRLKGKVNQSHLCRARGGERGAEEREKPQHSDSGVLRTKEEQASR
jgi:hypothetical protein